MDIKPLVVDLNSIDEWQRDRKDAQLQAWRMSNDIKETMTYRQAAYDSFIFYRDIPQSIFGNKLDRIEAVSTHTSKSIEHAVYHYVFDNGTQLIIRDNFHGHRMTVISPDPLAFPTGLFCNRGDLEWWTEGFDKSWLRPNYSDENKSEFSVELYDKYFMFTFLFLLNEQL